MAVCAVVKLRIDKAVNPFVRDAKHDLSVEAVPILSSSICILSVETSEDDRSLSALGPEITRDGRVQGSEDEVEAEASEADGGGAGGGPIIPPSRNEISIG